MHMARLWDTSMEKWAAETGYSLEALSLKLLGEFCYTPHAPKVDLGSKCF